MRILIYLDDGISHFFFTSTLSNPPYLSAQDSDALPLLSPFSLNGSVSSSLTDLRIPNDRTTLMPTTDIGSGVIQFDPTTTWEFRYRHLELWHTCTLKFKAHQLVIPVSVPSLTYPLRSRMFPCINLLLPQVVPRFSSFPSMHFWKGIFLKWDMTCTNQAFLLLILDDSDGTRSSSLPPSLRTAWRWCIDVHIVWSFQCSRILLSLVHCACTKL